MTTRRRQLLTGTAILVFFGALLGACSDGALGPAQTPGVTRIPTKQPSRDYSVQDGSQITVYDDESGWTRLDVAAQTLTDNEGRVVPLSAEQTITFLNDYQATVAFDAVSNAIDEIPPCTEYCVEPSSTGTDSLSNTGGTATPKVQIRLIDKTEVRAKPSDRFGYVVIGLDKTLKDLAKSQKKSGGITTLEWPPNCGTSITQVRAAKDDYISKRHSVTHSVRDLFSGVFPVDANGTPSVDLAAVPGFISGLLDKFLFKSLSQSNLSIMSALYAGTCTASLPYGSAGFGWYPGAVLHCSDYTEQVSLDGGVHFFTTTVRECSYSMS